jgi:DUF1680 family protein
MDKHLKKLSHIPWNAVEINGGFWQSRMQINEEVTLKAEYEQCKTTGRIDSIKCIYDPKQDEGVEGVLTIDGIISYADQKDRIPRPHHYWDSDIAKWIEAAAYSLTNKPDKDLEKTIDEIVDDFEKLQQPDGYMNTYFTVVEPGKRWTNVYQMHELYCAGHLIEGAVAYYQATGKRKFLDIICKFADHIDNTFGPEEGKIHGYPGHQEIELALVKLYHVTGCERYLNLSKYFLDERGKPPLFFEQEAIKYGRDLEDGGPKGILGKSFIAKGPYALFQSHLPIREQDTAEGHAVRVMYMGCGAADVAVETGDKSLLDASERLWDNVTLKRMYVTGGVGSQDGCERFNFDYQLPNESAYNETCASIGLAMWGSRMLQAYPDIKYADIMEKALYNGVISGVSLSGDKFFYANHLASHPGLYEDRIVTNPRMFPERQDWFPVSCCPMNLARLTESIGGYIYSTSNDTLYIHLYADSHMNTNLSAGSVGITQETSYPWDEDIKVSIDTEAKAPFKIAVRIPGWCQEAEVSVNGKSIDVYKHLEKGYLTIEKIWENGDIINIHLPMKPILIEANPSVRMDCGKVAIQCGPIIYCLEEEDNGKDLFDIVLTKDSKTSVVYDKDLLGGVNYIIATAKRRSKKNWEGALYKPVSAEYEDIEIKAIPYYAWSNRRVGEMTVWIGYQHNL